MSVVFKRIFLLIMLLALIAGKVSAQPKSIIRHYSTEDGLSHDIITCMFKDSEGFMWFGTWDGINRFDGHNFLSFKSAPGDRSQLNSDRIIEIVEDKSNHLWVRAYDGNIYRFDKTTQQFESINAILGLKEPIVFDHILSCTNNTLWLSSANSGLIRVPDTRNGQTAYYLYGKNKPEGFALPSNQISFLQQDHTGAMWAGTSKGLAYLDKDKNGIYRSHIFGSGGYNGFDYTASTTSDNKLYFGTKQGQLIIFDTNTRAFSAIKLSSSSLNSLLLARDKNTLYITTAAGELVTINTLNLDFKLAVCVKGQPLRSMFEDKDKNIWIEPDKVGIIRYNVASNSFKTYIQETDYKNVYPLNHFKVYEDNKGVLWAALRDGGFGYYDPAADKIAYYFNNPSVQNRLISNLAHSLYYDADGILWLNTDEGGIEKIIFQPNSFNQQLLQNPWKFKTDNEVRGLLCDRKNRLWSGVKSGVLYIYENRKPINIHFTNMPKDGFGQIYTIIQDHTGAVWLGTKAGGVYRAVPVNTAETAYRLDHYASVPGDHKTISSNQIYALMEDVQGRVWIGTFDGGLNLAVPTQGGFKITRLGDVIPAKTSDAITKIRSINTDKYGNLWIATTTGLAVLDTSHSAYKTHLFKKEPGNINSLGNNDVQYIYRDAENRMWLATAGGGLNLANGNPLSAGFKFKIYTKDNGLPNDYLLSCTEDLSHHIWVATQSGLSRFDPVTERFQNYNSYDGIPKIPFSEASCQRMKDGTIVFGTYRGYLWFDPASIKNNPIGTRLAFTDLQVNSEYNNPGTVVSTQRSNINNTDGIELNHHQNIFSIDYTVLDFRGSDKQTYLYRLNGFDNIWQNNQGRRRVTFTNLPPGKYQLEVKCISQDLYTNVPIKKLAITILPPPWRTWWAYLIYCLIAIVILEVVRRNAMTILRLRHRIAVEHQLTELKVKFFTNISHELRTPLTLILNPLEEIAKREHLSDQGNQYMQVVRRNANRMARFINQLLDLRKVQSGKAILNKSVVDVQAFVKEIGAYFNELGREKNITLNIVCQPEPVYAWLDADKIETVLYNLISNAYKFTADGKTITVKITADEAKQQLNVEVADQGTGVQASELADIFELYYEGGSGKGGHMKGTGIGLALSKELIELHHGTITAGNNSNGGLTVSFMLPLTRPLSANTAPEDADLFNNDPEHAILAAIDEVPGVHLRNPLVLLVEDNMDMRTFLDIQLKEFYRVELAENGLDGLKKAQAIAPDIIISDIMMPQMSGIQMLEKLKNDTATSHIPVILLSAKSAIESQIEGLQYGADYYITKPFSNEFLLATVANILGKRRKIAEGLINDKKVVELNPAEITITSKDEIFLNRILEVVESKMADPDFNIDTVAGMLNMGRTAFFRKFKGLTQLAPVEFVRDMRLKRAKQHFDGGNDNIAEVGYIVGFNSSKYFSTCFRAKYHLSPSDYLKMVHSKTQ